MDYKECAEKWRPEIDELFRLEPMEAQAIVSDVVAEATNQAAIDNILHEFQDYHRFSSFRSVLAKSFETCPHEVEVWQPMAQILARQRLRNKTAKMLLHGATIETINEKLLGETD